MDSTVASLALENSLNKIGISFSGKLIRRKYEHRKNSRKEINLKPIARKINFDEAEEMLLSREKSLKKFAENLLMQHPDWHGRLDFRYEACIFDKHKKLYLIRKSISERSEFEVFHTLRLEGAKRSYKSRKRQILLEFLKKIMPAETDRLKK